MATLLPELQSQCHHFDAPGIQGNGYRSIISACHALLARTARRVRYVLSHTSLVTPSRLRTAVFRVTHNVAELKASASALHQFRSLLYIALAMQKAALELSGNKSTLTSVSSQTTAAHTSPPFNPASASDDSSMDHLSGHPLDSMINDLSGSPPCNPSEGPPDTPSDSNHPFLFLRYDLPLARAITQEQDAFLKSPFYGRCLGFQFDRGIRPFLQALVVAAATVSEANRTRSAFGYARSLLAGGRFAWDAEGRGERFEQALETEGVEFWQDFWNQTESGLLASVQTLTQYTVAINHILCLPPVPLTLPLASSHRPPSPPPTVTIPPPLAHFGPGPVRVRLLSAELREGQDSSEWLAPITHRTSSITKKSWVRRRNLKPLPRSANLIVHFHGGGFVSQTSRSHENYLREWSHQLSCPVVSVDYSLSPAAPFPRALEECFYTYAWSLCHAERLGWTGERVCVAGDSAGGNLAVGVCIRARSLGLTVPRGLLLAYPAMMLRPDPSPSRLLALSDPLLPLAVLTHCLRAYAGTPPPAVIRGEDVDNKFASPRSVSLGNASREWALDRLREWSQGASGLFDSWWKVKSAENGTHDDDDEMSAISRSQSALPSSSPAHLSASSNQSWSCFFTQLIHPVVPGIDIDPYGQTSETFRYDQVPEHLSLAADDVKDRPVNESSINEKATPIFFVGEVGEVEEVEEVEEDEKENESNTEMSGQEQVMSWEEIFEGGLGTTEESSEGHSNDKSLLSSICEKEHSDPCKFIKGLKENKSPAFSIFPRGFTPLQKIARGKQNKQEEQDGEYQNDMKSKAKERNKEDRKGVRVERIMQKTDEESQGKLDDNDDEEKQQEFIPCPPLTNDPLVSPLLLSDKDLSGLPPTYILACEFDPMLDDSVALASRLSPLGRLSGFTLFPSLPHGCLSLSPLALKALSADASQVNVISTNVLRSFFSEA
uniref:Hormone-sensitive lipase n=1 Tax=Eptatretus burgeri TaxID=7764 RepID=A0A8C4QYR9_EPTBU